ncbi:MAG TPA: hypothetical protein VN745_00590 [Verrucomicrobiae bacterium]|nr:hypothetical protein [Verrucomicrobiae bacterium]
MYPARYPIHPGIIYGGIITSRPQQSAKAVDDRKKQVPHRHPVTSARGLLTAARTRAGFGMTGQKTGPQGRRFAKGAILRYKGKASAFSA